MTNLCQSSRRFRDQIRLSFDQPSDFKGMWMGGLQAPRNLGQVEKDLGQRVESELETWSRVRKAFSSVQISVLFAAFLPWVVGRTDSGA